MTGLKVKCRNCGRVLFETTPTYDASVTPNGGMVRSLSPYAIDWLTTSTTLPSEMTCPECLAPMVVNNRLLVVNDEPEKEKPDELPFVCETCGKAFKIKAAMMGHTAVHKKREV